MPTSEVLPALRNAAFALRSSTVVDPGTGWSNLGLAGTDDEASALAELGGLLDALADVVAALPGTEGRGRPALDELDDTLRSASSQATDLCMPPDPAVG